MFQDQTLLSRSVYVVDEDPQVRRAVAHALEADSSLTARSFRSTGDLLCSEWNLAPGLVLLDVAASPQCAAAALDELLTCSDESPVIAMSNEASVPLAVHVMKLGAIDFLEKPFDLDRLLGSLDFGFHVLDQRRQQVRRERDAAARIAALSPRELEVLRGLSSGLSNKQLAKQLGVSVRTIEMHRANMMVRLQVRSFAEALMAATDARLSPLLGS